MAEWSLSTSKVPVVSRIATSKLSFDNRNVMRRWIAI
jgi:hypothetical protein